MDGDVIGVNTAILSPNGGSIGIGFSMASNVVTKVVDQLREFGETRRGWLGVRIQDVTDEIAEALAMSEAKGALVSDVPEGPAKEAGIEAGDVIISFDGTEVEDTRQLVRVVANTPVNKTVRVVVNRNGETQTLKVTLGRREEAEGAATPAAEPAEPSKMELLGMTLSPLTDELRETLSVPKGTDGLAIVEIAEDSEAFDKGLRNGDVITEAGQTAIKTLDDLQDRVAEARDEGRKSLLLLVRRGGDPRFVALGVEE
jgi:serine protease Do